MGEVRKDQLRLAGPQRLHNCVQNQQSPTVDYVNIAAHSYDVITNQIKVWVCMSPLADSRTPADVGEHQCLGGVEVKGVYLPFSDSFQSG